MKNVAPISECKVFCKVGDRKTGYNAEQDIMLNIRVQKI